MKKLIILILILCTCVNFAFADENYSNWAKEEIEEAIEKGYIPESLQNNYQRQITRAEFCDFIITTIFKSAGHKYFTQYAQANREHLEFIKSPFDDLLPTNEMAIVGAYNLKIVNGKSKRKFHPDDLITREEASKMLVNAYRVLLANEYHYYKNQKKSQTTFLDDGEISNWAKDYVYEAFELKLIAGVGDKRFDPKGNLTREQAYLMGLRAAKKARENSENIEDELIKDAQYYNDYKGKSYQLSGTDLKIKEEDIKVPVITLDSLDSQFVNNKIKEVYDEAIDRFAQNYKAQEAHDFTTLNYKYNRNNEILSVLLYSFEGGNRENYYDYASYHFSLKHPAKLLNNTELLKHFGISDKKLKDYVYNQMFETIDFYQSFYLNEGESINMSDYTDSVEIFDRLFDAGELAFYMADSKDMKKLTLFLNYVGDPAGTSDIFDVIQLTDNGGSQLWQSVYDNLKTYGSVSGVLIYMPRGEVFTIKDQMGKLLKVEEIDTKVENADTDMYFIALEDIKFTLTDIQFENNYSIDKEVIVNDYFAQAHNAYKMPITFSKHPNKSLKLTNIKNLNEFTIHYINKQHDEQFFNVLNKRISSTDQ